ncbi:hypothetical protein GCM10025768_24200 [Microbacterium pseudoresistens]|uniref:Peptidoglycan/LPS O-acetylase OafA/YrhL n=1 Tax=Microbacterium pseudoresistens TaxID=640634 RepID=A0A7Y9JNQ7_9MICO|nr:acyltransferase [Microbacterium pseudoresistens]NYD55371.1 peptidoglycan/LPS O-acetylase OafA/YrhL [Microbacterium pseudoresistens]
MTVIAPTPRQIAATPRSATVTSRREEERTTSGHPARDRGIDLVRAFCVLCVVSLHALMVGVALTPDGPVFENAAEGAWWAVPLSWALQVMPLFFVVAGFAGRRAFDAARSRGRDGVWFVTSRLHRLLRPAVAVVAVVGIALCGLLLAGVPAELVAVAGFRYGQPLWFLGVFLLCQALLPLAVRWHERAPLRTVGVLVGAAVAVDAARAVTGLGAVGMLNLAFVWLALQQLGFFLADGRIDALPRRVRIGAGALAAALLVVLCLTGVWSADLVSHLNPPTTALLLVGAAHTCLLSLLRPPLAALAERPLPAALTAFVTRRTMTIYLWHMPVLLTLAGTSALLGMAGVITVPVPGSGSWWLERPAWLILALALTALLAVPLTRIEHTALPLGTTEASRAAIATVLGILGVVLLLAAGTTPLTAAAALLLFAAALRLRRSARRSEDARAVRISRRRDAPVGGRAQPRRG